MMKDLLLSVDKDLQFADGDLVIGNSESQSEELLLLSNKGDFKQYPDRCVGVERYLKDEGNSQELLAEIKKEYERDGMVVKKVELTPEGKLLTHAYY